MISLDPWPVIRARYARAIQRGDSPERIAALRAELRAVRCRDYLTEVLAADPPLTTEHRRELAGLILAGARALMPPDERGRPLAGNQESGLHEVDAHASEFDSLMVRHGGGQRRVQRGDGSRKHPVLAPASAYHPLGRRTWVAYSYSCHVCHTWHLGRAPTLAKVTGPRRAGCGHWVTVMIARLYGQPEGAA